MTEKSKMKKKPLNKKMATQLFDEIAMLSHVIKTLAYNMESEEAGALEVLAEKSGWLASRGRDLCNGGAGVADFADFANAPSS